MENRMHRNGHAGYKKIAKLIPDLILGSLPVGNLVLVASTSRGRPLSNPVKIFTNGGIGKTTTLGRLATPSCKPVA